ncbi:accessory Sec system protein Asp2 [Lacticaseibacillus casei]|nr:accessory Sec system protein Asp2 [Lacticaseibacillus casei]
MADNAYPVLQLGTQAIPLQEHLTKDFAFEFISNAAFNTAPTPPAAQPDKSDSKGEPAEKPDQPPISLWQNAGMTQLRREYATGLFIITEGAAVLKQPDQLIGLPANTIMYDETLSLTPEIIHILDLKQAHPISLDHLDQLGEQIVLFFYPAQWGIRVPFGRIEIADGFSGSVMQQGSVGVTLKGDFGRDLQPSVYWRGSLGIGQMEAIAISIECETAGDVEVWAKLQMVNPQNFQIAQKKLIPLSAFRDDTILDTKAGFRFVNITLMAKGNGTVKIRQVHLRRSRGKYGTMFIGGKRLKAVKPLDGELLSYFDAGDLKPPLSVYFSGYRSAEGFEGNFMMKAIRNPFLLFSDARLEGGAFYLGDPQLENQVVEMIQATLKRLGFRPDELILSGLSMGTLGALYYGAKLDPRAILVGKPLINLGTIAENGRVRRSADFATAFDMLMMFNGSATHESAEKINQRIWRTISGGKFDHTFFAIAHMLDDDYEHHAFDEIVKWLNRRQQHNRVLHIGLHGRHNDNTNEVNAWFLRQYHMILTQEFGRSF